VEWLERVVASWSQQHQQQQQHAWSSTQPGSGKTTISSFSSVFARRTAAAVLDQLLQRIVQEQKSGNVYADHINLTRCYHLLIVAWASTTEVVRGEDAAVS